MTNALMPTYARLPVTFAKGEGALLWDTAGKQYLDALSGIAVCNIGHARPEVADAICEQARALLHTSNLYQIEHQQALGEKLCALAGLDNVFFGNSGAEANEAAIKIARLYAHNKGIERPVIIVMTHSFHGRTMATVTATGNAKAQAGFGPLLEGFVRVEYGDVEAVEAHACTACAPPGPWKSSHSACDSGVGQFGAADNACTSSEASQAIRPRIESKFAPVEVTAWMAASRDPKPA